MTEANDIYDREGMLPADYVWDARGRALVRTVRAGQMACRVAAVALIIVTTAWCVTEGDAFANILPFLVLMLAILTLCSGVDASLSMAVRRSLWKADPRARHDYSLWLYRHGPGRMPKQAATLLLGMARADMEDGKVDAAKCALGHINEGQLGLDELKLFHLLGLVVCLNSADGKKHESEKWLIRYEAVPQKSWEGFPDPDVARAWLDSEDGAASAIAAMERVRAPRGIHPAFALLLVLMVSHCVAYLALLYGVNADAGWKLRCGYANVGSLLTSLSLVVLGVAAAVLSWTRGPRRQRGDAAGTALSVLLSAMSIVLAFCLALTTFVDGALAYDGEERVVASGVEDTYTGRRYDYLAVDWTGYDPRDVTTDWWRTDNPLLMEKWSDAKAYDTKVAENQSSGAVASSGDTTSSEGVTSDENVANSGQGSGTDDTDANLQASQERMRVLASYLVGQGIVPQTDVFQIGADAKGNAYTSLGTGTDSEDGKAVAVEYRILSNGETAGAGGRPSEEFVLEKWYPEDEGRNPQILGFYLVDESTSAVTDEGRTSW